MKLKLITPEKLILERNVESVTMPGMSGQLTVMPGHDIMVAGLSEGSLFFRYSEDDKPKREDYKIGAGGAHITQKEVKVFVVSAVKV